MAKLNAFDAEVERDRTRLQALSAIFIELCTAMSAGATALQPAVRLLEKMTGALARLSGVSMPALPPPADYGMIDPPPADDLPD